MMHKKKTYKDIGIAAAIVCVLLLLGGLVFALRHTERSAANDECIRCHVSAFNRGLKNKELHAPFWERNCMVCHLPSGSDWSGAESVQKSAQLTGTLVNQEDLWRKVQRFSAGRGSVTDHLVSLSGLEMNTAYRFRILASPTAKTAGTEVFEGLWLGLHPAEVIALGSTQPIDIGRGLSASLANIAKSASLSGNGSSIYVSWQSVQPLFGWVEVQELEGLSLAGALPEAQDEGELTSAQGQHPTLRESDDLAIEACYQCHPESSLGTSHPVRLYGGRDVRIPESLPTVEGMLTCVTCHNPHGAEGKMLVREMIKTKLCVACHYKFKNSSTSTMFD